MLYFFETIFYKPLFNLLVFTYNVIPGHDLGLVIIIITFIVKLALLPLSKQSIKAQKALQDLQPKIEELKAQYANDKEALGRAMISLYKDNKVNPLSSCLPLLIQLPFLIAVYNVFSSGINNKQSLDLVYSFVYRPESINSISMGIVDLSAPNIVFAVLAGIAQFWQAKMMTTKTPEIKNPGAQDENMMAIMNKQMLYIMPVMTVFIGASLPGGLSLYWLVLTLLTVAQQLYVLKHKEN